MTLEDHKAAVRRQYEEGLNLGKLDQVLDVFTADYVHHIPMSPEPLGLDAFQQMFSAFLTAFPDMTVVIDDILAEGDRVAARARFQGTHHGEFMGLPPTGRTESFAGNDIYRMVDGRIAEEWAQFDALGLLQQLGAVPALPGSH